MIMIIIINNHNDNHNNDNKKSPILQDPLAGLDGASRGRTAKALDGRAGPDRMHMHAYACICMHAHACICTHAHACICIHAYACVSMHAYACRRMVAPCGLGSGRLQGVASRRPGSGAPAISRCGGNTGGLFKAALGVERKLLLKAPRH